MKNEHTPGPWHVECPTNTSGYSVWAGGMLIARAHYADFDEANARLISAAPLLLQACKAQEVLERHSCRNCTHQDDCDGDPLCEDLIRVIDDASNLRAAALAAAEKGGE